MNRALTLAVGVALAASLAVLLLARERTRNPSQAEDYAHLPRPAEPAALWPAPTFSFEDQRGATVSRQVLAGKPWVANFVFTTCRTVCPLLTAKMVRLQRDVEGDVRFVSFSVDPTNDTPAALADYAKRWNADEARWHLLRTTPEGLAAVTAGFRVTAQRTDGGVDPILHSAVFVLVDGRGVVRGVYDSEDSADWQALTGALRELSGKAAPPPRAERSGEVLYHELSCANCHERPELAPPLGGVSGRRRELESRLLVDADDAYLKESVLAPDAKRVAGYPLKMPSYAGLVSAAELSSLLGYVKALPAPTTAAPDVAVAVDPVCHMKVRVTPDALHEGDVYFCSAWCRDRWREAPDAYRPAAPAP